MDLVRTVELDVFLLKYKNVRKQTEKLCLPLSAEDMAVQPMTDVSPPKWHLGHSTWFYETFILKRYYKNYKLFDSNYGFLFNSYYESVGDRVNRKNRGGLTRPSLQEVFDYRVYVDNHMEKLFGRNNLPEEFFMLLELGLNHEQQHQELLLTDIKYILGSNPLFPAYKPEGQAVGVDNKLLNISDYTEIPGGFYHIGHDGEGFSYDNETPVHKVYLPTFYIANRLITNKEYLEFVMDGGYDDHRLWLMEGWEKIRSENWQSPLYWENKNGDWYEFTLSGLQKLNPDLPVTHISFYEADAYANWAGKRLLTEYEWEAACQVLQPHKQKGNFAESELYHPSSPAKAYNQMFGDVWEWTYSAYHPYPGYKKAEGALGEYNGKFMLNQMVLRGGSCATPMEHIRGTYRNFFHPDRRWQFSGIRLAEKV